MTKLSKTSDAVRWGRAGCKPGEEADLPVNAGAESILENGGGAGVRLRKVES